MAITNPDSVNAGDTLYDCHKQRQGNTMVSAMGCWRVKVISVERGGPSGPQFTVSWNTNAPKTVGWNTLRKWSKRPARVRSLRRLGDGAGVRLVCATCGSTEDLSRCTCSSILCKAHRRDDRCGKKVSLKEGSQA